MACVQSELSILACSAENREQKTHVFIKHVTACNLILATYVCMIHLHTCFCSETPKTEKMAEGVFFSMWVPVFPFVEVRPLGFTVFK
jgi:hypothetical protein